MLMWYVLPPVVIPALNCEVALILPRSQLSEVPKSARSPVSGWMKAIVMSLVLEPVEVEVEAEAPLMLELQASSSPPPPTTAAPAPAARSTPRRLTPRGDESPSPPLAGDVLSGCAVWSLMCNLLPLRSRPKRGTASEVAPRPPQTHQGMRGVMRLAAPNFRPAPPLVYV